MKCAHCGNMLSPGSAYCTACGASAAAPATPAGAPQNGEEAPQTDSALYSNQQFRAQTAFYGRYGMRVGNAALPAPSSLALPTAPAESADTKSAPPPASAPAPADEPAAARASAAPVPAAPADKPASGMTAPLIPKQRRPLAGRLVALSSMLLLLALLVGVSAFGFRAYTKNQSETRATATVSARIQATATAAAQATASASVPLFTDSLASNTNGWLENGSVAFFAGGQYHLRNTNPTMTLNSYYQQQTFDNFRVQITVTADSDANPNANVPYAYGLVLRANPGTPGNKYVFFVSPAGTYNFARHDVDGFLNNGWSDLTTTPWAGSSAIHKGKGAANTLMVIARDNTFTLFINGQQVEVVTDSFGSYASGWIGVMVEGADMEASFSNMQVYGPEE